MLFKTLKWKISNIIKRKNISYKKNNLKQNNMKRIINFIKNTIFDTYQNLIYKINIFTSARTP